MLATKIWACISLLTMLGIAKFSSISGGPSAGQAILAIRVAQRELYEARPPVLDSAPSAIRKAEAMLEVASRALREKRYEEAILAAREASRQLRTLGGSKER